MSTTTESTNESARKTQVTRQHRDSSRRQAIQAILGLVVVAFVAGSAVTEFRVFPYRQVLQPSFAAARSLHQRIDSTSSLRNTDFWSETKDSQRGVTIFDPTRSQEGYTLYTSGHESSAFLIDRNGRVVHKWHLAFRQAWDRPPHVDHPVPERFIYWRRAHLFPNGDLLAMYVGYGDTPWGYGLVKVDRNSKVIWKFAEHVHHDLCIDSNGSIYTLTHEFRDSVEHPVSGVPHLRRTLLDDFVVQLSPDGGVLKRVSLLDAIARSDYQDLLTSASEKEWDLLHTNDVSIVSPEFASHHPFARPGQLMISMRSRQALGLLDFEQERIVWASCGPFRYQHDPDPLDNGHVMVFDNRGHAGIGGPSRVIQYDPVTEAIQWSYTGDKDHPLYSRLRSAQQILPNGNILITESGAGRLLEVTRDGAIVWEFRNPVDLDGDRSMTPIVCAAERFPKHELDFEFNHGKLSAGTESR